MKKVKTRHFMGTKDGKLVELIPAEHAKPGLISVKDRLPKKKREYLCVCQFGDDSNWRYYNVLLFHPEKNADNGCVKGPHFSNEGMDDMRVTHWMELPELPERDGE